MLSCPGREQLSTTGGRSYWLLRGIALFVLLTASGSPAATEYTDDGVMGPRQEVQRWLVNRARYAPESEADLLKITNTTAGGHPDYDCCEDSTNANDFGTSAVDWAPWKQSKGPLAPNARLIAACTKHSTDMSQTDDMDHYSPSSNFYPLGSAPLERDAREGYTNGIFGYYENIGWSSSSNFPMADFHVDLFTDYSADSRGHRQAILNPEAREIGIGLCPSNGLWFTQDYGRISGVHFFTDTIFRDTNADNVYTEGEGVSNVQVRLKDNGVEGAWYDVSTAGGNFAIPIAAFTDGHSITVELVNKTAGSIVLYVPTGWGTGRNVTLESNGTNIVGSFTQPASDTNVGFRNMTQPPAVGQLITQYASSVTPTSAVLSATLNCTGRVYGVRACWNTVNGGTNALLWTNSALVGTWTNAAFTNISRAITGLQRSNQYYFTFCATNMSTTVWSSNVMSFTTLSGLPADTNADGIADAWTALHFSGQPADGTADNDADGDGLNNFMEYKAGSDPTNRNDRFEVRICYSNSMELISFLTRTTATNYYGALVRQYALERLTNMMSTNWTTVPTYDDMPATGQAVIFTNNISTNLLFYRAKAWLE